MPNEIPTPEALAAADLALRWIYPDLKFNRHQITPDAAVFAFVVLKKVNFAARMSYGAFKLYGVPTGWSFIPKQVISGALGALKKPGKSLSNRVSLALIAWPHQRNLQKHLNEPDVYPCPDFRNDE